MLLVVVVVLAMLFLGVVGDDDGESLRGSLGVGVGGVGCPFILYRKSTVLYCLLCAVAF